MAGDDIGLQASCFISCTRFTTSHTVIDCESVMLTFRDRLLSFQMAGILQQTYEGSPSNDSSQRVSYQHENNGCCSAPNHGENGHTNGYLEPINTAGITHRKTIVSDKMCAANTSSTQTKAQNPSPMKKTGDIRLSAYLVALRPWSFAASLTPVALGSCLCYKYMDVFSPWVFGVTCLVALSVHAAGNLVNTYFDYMRGVDSVKSSLDDRTLVDHILSPNDVATMGAVFYMVGCGGFVLLVILSPARMEHLALIYFGGLSSSFLYTGGLGLKYIGLGDIAIFMTFGPLAVLFAYVSQGGALNWMPMIYALPVALNTAAILHSNNSRDAVTDAKAGIVTLAILIGPTLSYLLFVFLLFIPYIIMSLLVFHCTLWFILPLTTLIPAFKYERLFRDGSLNNLPRLLSKLNLQMGLLFTLAFAMTSKNDLPGMS